MLQTGCIIASSTGPFPIELHTKHDFLKMPINICTEFSLNIQNPGGGPLECQGGYQARPKIHVIRVVFQDQALYARTSFRGAKTCKIGKKGVFLVI